MSVIELFQKAADLGLKLGIEPGSTLTVQPAKHCPRDFADTLRQHKSHLLVLLRLSFCVAYSKTLSETIFLCEDEDTKAGLVAAGAQPGSIYTRPEVQILVNHHRAKPFIPDELPRIHQAKKIFKARIQVSGYISRTRLCEATR